MDKAVKNELTTFYEIDKINYKINKVVRHGSYINWFKDASLVFYDELKAYEQLQIIILEDLKKLNDKLLETTIKIEELAQ